MVLGDFNARVGVLKTDADQWHGVLGKHGLDERSEAGEDYLQLCLESAVSDEHLVPEEDHPLWNMDASSNEDVART